MPLWYACLDGRIYLQTRGRKLQRIRRDPRASFLVESGEHWKDLRRCTARAWRGGELDADLA
ncbi:MAG: hypothetical protein R2755_08975 [Acidimicrobiales bacterium]